jgi:arylsulfatase A-like enzyme
MMNKQFLKKFSLCLLVTVSLIWTIGCGSSRKKESRIIRIIDRISKENVVRSPLKNIIEQFNSVEEDMTGKWIYISELSSRDQEIWGTSSGFPILGNHESEFPEGMKLVNDGKEVVYLSGKNRQNVGWRWIGTSETLDLRGFEGYDKTRRGIILTPDNSFRFEKLLPKGNLIIDVYLVNLDWQNTQPSLTVSFNGNDADELVITRKKWFRIRKKCDLGKYNIEIRYTDPNEKNIPKTPLVLGQVKVTGNSDILLLTHPKKKKRAAPQGEYHFSYHTHVALPGKIKAVQPEIQYLYNIRNKFPLQDKGIGTDPFSLKKKITFDEYAYNCLAAPPESVFTTELDVPSNANFLLEFGYGILNEFRNRVSDQSIQFNVTVERSGKEETLFDKTIHWETAKNIISAKIDLSPFAGKNVRLFFHTRDRGSISGGENSPPVIPVWVNPLIYQNLESTPTQIILISLDTVRPDHLGCYGYKRETSPSIDRLAADSVLFKNAFSTTSWTLPGHVSLLTALECRHHQVYFPLQKMSTDVVTAADILRTEQFYCAGFTGGGYLSESYGFSKGFDSYQEIKLHGDQAIRLDEAERLAQMASQWLEDHKDKNFFLFLHTYQPHDPYANLSPAGREFLDENSQWDQVKMESLFNGQGRFNAPISDTQRSNIIALYDGEIRYTDLYFVQPILDKMKELGLYEKAMIVLTSDHGEEFLDHEAWLHDHSLYDEAIRIPLIVKLPDAEHKGSEIDNIVRITDIVPTILDQMGIKGYRKAFDGSSMLPLINRKEKTPRIFVSDLALREFEMAPTVIAINKENFKFILNKRISSPYTQRVVHLFDGAQIELYDLVKDPKETKNLATNIAYRELCFQLLDTVNRLYEQTDLIKREKDEVTLDQSLRERLKALGYIK